MQGLGERIKSYEKASDFTLLPKCPVIIRVDGKCFHSFTKKEALEKPFSDKLINSMADTAYLTAKQMAGFKLAYVQSDEATFLLSDLDKHESQAWFGNSVQKLASITASIFTAHFNRLGNFNTLAMFDARCFNVPIDDVPNVFVWRQKDWERNSLQMFARSVFSHKELHNKTSSQIHEMLYLKGLNWSDLKSVYKNGTFITSNRRLNEKLTYDDIKELIEEGTIKRLAYF